MFFPGPNIPNAAPLRNREPGTAPATMTNVIDERLHIVGGSALDMSALRGTAVPAGSKGRITAVGDQLREGSTAVRFFVATIQPETTFTPIPSSKAEADAGAAYLARQGFNAIRLMGLEHWFKYGLRGVAVFDPVKVDAFDYFLYACKQQGIYWIPCTQSYNAFEDIADPTKPFDYTEATSTKPRMYTEAEVRANWKTGFGAIYNRVNPYTGINILQDPATLLVEPYNEQSTTFCGGTQFPSRWLTRTSGSTAAAKTWLEWLQDTTAAHGYADLAALNTSWGTAFASYTLAAADPMPALTNAIPMTQKSIDVVKYTQYLEDDMAAFYSACLTEWGYTGLSAWHTMYASHGEARGVAKYSVNSVANWHAYTNISYGGLTLVATTDADNPVWESERVALMSPPSSGAKPVWMGEMGNHTYARWRHQFPIIYASVASQGASAVAWFNQGDFFATRYYNDTSTHGDRLRRLDSFCAPGAHVNDFVRALVCGILLRGDVSAMTVSQPLILNDRHTGINPKSTGRIQRVYSTLLQPLQFLPALAKTRLNWTSDTTDDTLAATWGLKDLKTICQDMQTAGAIAADHPTLVSATANSGSIVSVATTGTVGGLTASTAQPVLDIGSNTLVDGDLIHITNMTGSVGTWPGTNSRTARSAVVKGTGNYVQLVADTTRNVSGLSLSGLSGTNFTAGTWCEGANVLEGGGRQWGMSRRLKRAFINTPKLQFFGHTNAALPITIGQVTVSALTQNASVFVMSLDGTAISSSSRLLIGLCGEAINTGMTYTVGADGKQTLTATGNYPVQQLDATATLSLAVTLPQAWRMYRLNRDGSRGSAESPAQVDAAAARLIVTLRTGVIQPAVLWELER